MHNKQEHTAMQGATAGPATAQRLDHASPNSAVAGSERPNTAPSLSYPGHRGTYLGRSAPPPHTHTYTRTRMQDMCPSRNPSQRTRPSYLHVVDEQRRQAAQPAVPMTSACTPALLNSVCCDPCAGGLETAGQGMQLRQGREVPSVARLLKGLVHGCKEGAGRDDHECVGGWMHSS